ncbi:hypothetical protein AADZ86_08815 [Colwelliaceae bacterium BS250]
MSGSLFKELRRRNVFKVGFGYLVLAWLVIQVASIAVPALGMPEAVNTVVFFFGMIGFPFAIFFAWAFEMTPDGLKKESEISAEESIHAHTGRKLDFIIIGLLVVALGYFVYESRFASQQPTNDNSVQASQLDNQVPAQNPALTQADTSENQSNTSVETVIPLAVLPFVNMSNDENQEYFVDGLTEELLNSLTRVKGLKVTARTSSFEYKGQNTDLREIAKKLNVDYLVEGSVRKIGEDIRITVQLIEAENGSHILSKTFDRKLVKVFELQEEISQQVAAALNLVLVLKDERYSSALSTMDYIAVEQLVKTRALVNWEEGSATDAYHSLVKLDQQYPNTPEIIGLLAHVSHIAFWTGNLDLTMSDVEEFAKKALKLDRENLDALRELAKIYRNDPQYSHLAKNTFQDMIRYYPGKAGPYTDMIYFLHRSMSSCEDISAFLDTVPEGLFNVNVHANFEFLVRLCLTPNLADKEIAAKYNLKPKNKAFSYNLNTSAEFRYLLTAKKAKERRKVNNKLYQDLLHMKATESVAKLATQHDIYNSGTLTAFYVLSAYLYDIDAPLKPFEVISEIINKFRNISHAMPSMSLAKQALKDGKTEELKHYLSNVANFPIGIETIDHSIGLMVLQYYSGDKDSSRQTAIKLFNAIAEYKTAHPESYTHWGLYRGYFNAAFYSGNEDIATKILEEDFPIDAEYWIVGYESPEFLLLPWKDHPAVIEYLKRVEKDQLRMRTKYNLK